MVTGIMSNVLALIMSVIIAFGGVFSSIGSAGMGFFNLSKEVAELPNATSVTELTMEIPDEMYEFLSQNLPGMPQQIKMSMSVNMQTKPDMYADYVCNMSMGDTNIKMELVVVNNAMYITKDSYINVMNATSKMSGVELDKHEKALQAEMAKRLKDIDYISLNAPLDESTAAMMPTPEMLEGIKNVAKSLLEAQIGKDAKLFTKTENGYAFEMGAKDLANTAKIILSNILDNKDAFTKYTNKVMEQVEQVEIAQALIGDTSVATTLDDIYTVLDDALVGLNDGALDSEFASYDGSVVKSSIEKIGKDYITNMSAEFVQDKVATLNMKAKQTTFKNMGIVRKTVDAERVILLGDYMKMEDELKFTLAPADELEILLMDAGVAEVYVSRDDAYVDSLTVTTVLNENDRVYVPAEWSKYFGYKATQDGAVVTLEKNGAKHTLDVKLHDGKVLIAARDFEKLGLKVNFTAPTAEDEILFDQYFSGTITISK